MAARNVLQQQNRVQKFQGKPLIFTNDIDIDDHDDVIYFTDTSTKYQRRQYFTSLLSGDSTGRLMKYTKSTKEVTVLLGGLAFANGVALSKDHSFVLVVETSNSRILRYWLKGPYKGKHDTFAELPGFPDNIRINSKGEFWVALQSFAQVLSISGSDLLGVHATAMKLSEDGRVLEVLEDVEGKTLRSISEVHEKNGKLWICSVVMPFLGVYRL
ncbi:protein STRICTOSIDINE SYNTHASE-LIKE 10-like [Lycium ferocissimum]|uniref:protein STRICTOSIDINE SYNTHASE-LIKE 10-like n=1 Tax=Lycium ferocissimum TaxID=112874 RepID=UPI002815DE82|nr:protein STRICTOSIDINE SYNTHASE-LIKE 10-like [Lycium ferocissimum]